MQTKLCASALLCADKLSSSTMSPRRNVGINSHGMSVSNAKIVIAPSNSQGASTPRQTDGGKSWCSAGPNSRAFLRTPAHRVRRGQTSAAVPNAPISSMDFRRVLLSRSQSSRTNIICLGSPLTANNLGVSCSAKLSKSICEQPKSNAVLTSRPKPRAW